MLWPDDPVAVYERIRGEMEVQHHPGPGRGGVEPGRYPHRQRPVIIRFRCWFLHGGRVPVRRL